MPFQVVSLFFRQVVSGLCWVIDSAAYASNFYTIDGELDSRPNGVALNTDGTKMYVAGGSSDDILEYELGTPYDVDSAGYYDNLFDTSGEDGNLQDVIFNSDGTQMITTGSGNENVNRYTLGTAWDITSAVHGGLPEDVLSVWPTSDIWGSYTYGVKFSADGLTMYVAGRDDSVILQFKLLIPFNIQSAGHEGILLDVSAQGTETIDIAIDSNGTKMYVVDSDTDMISQYTLATPWDVSSGTYDNLQIRILDWLARYPQGIRFSPDGLTMYITDSNNDTITQYLLNTAWDISEVNYTDNVSVASQDTFPQGLAINNDGTKMYICGTSSGNIYEYTLSSAYDVTSATYNAVFLDSTDTAPTGLYFKPDGLRLYVTGDTGNAIHEYAISPAWDLSSANLTTSISVSAYSTKPTGLTFNDTGTKMFLTSAAPGKNITEFDLSPAWDLSTAALSVVFPVALSPANDIQAQIAFNDTGTRMYYMEQWNDIIYQVDLATAWDISDPIGPVTSKSVASGGYGLAFSPSGDYFYIAADTWGYQYQMTTPWDITTSSLITTMDAWRYTSTTYMHGHGVAFNSAGTKMFWAGADASLTTESSVYWFTISTPWILSSWVHAGNYLITGGGTDSPNGMYIGDSGTKVYVPGDTQLIHQYELETPYDLSTLVVSGKTNVGTTPFTMHSPQDISFKPDGLSVFVIAEGPNNITQWNLSSAWDISTMGTSPIASFSINPPERDIRGMYIGDSGYKLFIVGKYNDVVYEYPMNTAWDLSSISAYTASYQLHLMEVNGLGIYSAGQWTATSIRFNPTGDIMYVMGASGDIEETRKADVVQQVTLGTAWDLTTASYDTEFYQLELMATGNTGVDLGEESGLEFSADGYKMYVLDSITSSVTYAENYRPNIREYDLGTAWDITTAGYNNISVSTEAPLDDPTGIAFNDTGLIVYLSDGNTRSVHSYTLNTAYDLTSIIGSIYKPDKTFTINIIYSLSVPVARIEDVAFNSNGTKMYITTTPFSGYNTTIYQYDLSTAWDITTASRVPDTYATELQFTEPYDVTFSTNGLKMFISGTYQTGAYESTKMGNISQYTLTTPWDLSTAGYDNIFFDTRLSEFSALGLSISSDDTKLYLTGYSEKIHQFTLNGGSPSLADYSYDFALDVSARAEFPSGAAFKSDGTKMYVSNIWNFFAGRIFEYNLDTAWDISTAYHDGVYVSLESENYYTKPGSIAFNTDGTKMFIEDNGYYGSANNIHMFTLSPAWDITSAVHSTTEHMSPYLFTASAVSMNPEGTKLVVLSNWNKAVYQYDLSVANDLSTATYTSYFYVGDDETDPQGMKMCDSGERMFITGGDDPSTIRQYTLSTGWDLSTAVLDATTIDISTEDGDPTGIAFNSAQTKMYITGNTNNTVYQYDI